MSDRSKRGGHEREYLDPGAKMQHWMDRFIELADEISQLETRSAKSPAEIYDALCQLEDEFRRFPKEFQHLHRDSLLRTKSKVVSFGLNVVKEAVLELGSMRSRDAKKDKHHIPSEHSQKKYIEELIRETKDIAENALASKPKQLSEFLFALEEVRQLYERYQKEPIAYAFDLLLEKANKKNWDLIFTLDQRAGHLKLQGIGEQEYDFLGEFKAMIAELENMCSSMQDGEICEKSRGWISLLHYDLANLEKQLHGGEREVIAPDALRKACSTLGISIKDMHDKKVVKKAYLELVKNFHPDKFSAEGRAKEMEERVKEIIAAYQLIRGPKG